MSKAKPSYGNDSISSLKGADRVRKRPGVIFGSDGLEGCEHAVFEILSNSIDEAREGYGTDITTVRYADGSIEVSDHGRGIPVEWNEKEQRYNWELVFCELYAGGKYKNDTGENYEFSLGLNGLAACIGEIRPRTSYRIHNPLPDCAAPQRADRPWLCRSACRRLRPMLHALPERSERP